MQFQELGSERLRFRVFQEGDEVTLVSWVGDPLNMRYMKFDPQTVDKEREFVKSVIEKSSNGTIADFWYIVERCDSGRAIGNCGILVKPDSNEGEVGWLLHRDFQGFGYGTEIGRTLLNFGFDILKLHRIFATCDADNDPSYKLMERIGMCFKERREKARRGNSLQNHAWRDELVYEILQDNWITISKK